MALESKKDFFIRLHELDFVSCIHPPQGRREIALGTAVLRLKITAVLRGNARIFRAEGAKKSNPQYG